MRYVLPVLALLFLSLGCSPADSNDVDGLDVRSWIIDENAITLQEDLRISETDDFFFGRIHDVAIREDGRIYVADGEEHHVKVLSPEGELLETIGEQGEGPGEFERPIEVIVARGDSLYVLDGYRGRLSVFSPGHEFAYSRTVRGERRFPRKLIVPEGADGFIISYTTADREAAQGDAVSLVRYVNPRGEIGDTLFTTPIYPVLMEEVGEWMRYTPIPFARSAYLAHGSDDHIHYAWGDSLSVSVFESTGKQVQQIRLPYEPVPVTEADQDHVLGDRPDDQRTLLLSEMPDTKPVLTGFLIDDQDRYWFKRPNESIDEVEWWIAAPDAGSIAVTTLPEPIELAAVRAGYAYGFIDHQEHLPTLVRYRIIE